MPMDDGSGDLASYLIIVSKGDCIMRHTFAVLAAAGLLIGTIATGAEARHGMADSNTSPVGLAAPSLVASPQWRDPIPPVVTL